jgi:hypothetical protein
MERYELVEGRRMDRESDEPVSVRVGYHFLSPGSRVNDVNAEGSQRSGAITYRAPM